jgi:hypothetical protein
MPKIDPRIVDEAAGSAIAAFTLAQSAFWAVYKSGLLSKIEAEQMLRQGNCSKCQRRVGKPESGLDARPGFEGSLFFRAAETAVKIGIISIAAPGDSMSRASCQHRAMRRIDPSAFH